ncbi:MAG: hypothetical protein WCV69_03650 [Patescibacteria group bacterium]|jgi:hypothetical protein
MKKLFFTLMVMTMALPGFSLATAPAGTADSGPVVCDINNDGARNLSDVALYAGCADTFDVNNDGVHNLIDNALYSSNYQSNSWCQTNFRCSATTASSNTTDTGLAVCDINNDGARNLSDVALYAGCAGTFDVNNDGIHDLADSALYTSNYQSNSWCQANFRCAPTITDFSQYLVIAESRITNISDTVTRVYWRAGVGSSGEYRYSKNQSELNNLPWRSDGVSNGPEVTGNMFGSQVDLSGLEAGATYYIQVRKFLGTQYGLAKILTFVPGSMGYYTSALDIAKTRVDQLALKSARVYWQVVNMSSDGYYRYATSTDALAGLAWVNTGVLNGPEATGNYNASMVTLNNLQPFTKYYIEVKSVAGVAGEVSYRYGNPTTINFTTLGGGVLIDNKIKVCHVVGNGKTNTLEIAQSALAVHLAHGDKEGVCVADNGNSVQNREQERIMNQGADKNLMSRVRGRILLQVESHGEAWYVNPKDDKRFYLKDGTTAYSLMREAGLGITNDDLAKIPIGFEDRFSDNDIDGDGLGNKLEQGLGTDINKSDTDGDGVSDRAEILAGTNPLGTGVLSSDNALANRLKGKIVLQVQSRGEAWYIDPSDGKRYYMRDGEAAYQIMRFRSLGITDSDLSKIAQ